MARSAAQRGMYAITAYNGAQQTIAAVAEYAEIPDDLVKVMGAAATIDAEADRLRAGGVDPEQLASELAAAADPTALLEELGQRVAVEARRRLTADVLQEASEVARQRAAAAVNKAAPERLVQLLKPVYDAAVDDATSIVGEHPDVAAVDRANAVDLDPAKLAAWGKLRDAVRRFLDVYSLAEQLRNRAAVEQGHELLLAWQELPDGLKHKIERAQFPNSPPAPSVAELLAAGAIRRPLLTRSEVTRLLEDQRQAAEDRMDQRRARAGLYPTVAGADPTR